MKKILVLMLLFQGISFFSTAQVPGQKLVPKPVLDKFATDFPGITPKRWEVKAGRQFEAVLVHDNKACRARYFNTGEKHFTAYHYPAADVPSTISSTLLSSFTGFKIEWATRTINHKNNTDRYWIRLTKPGYVLKAFLNADGTAVADMKEEDMKDAEVGN
jgi:hypothetical protein